LISVKKIRVLCVCMGNICRSPTAEAVLRRKLEAAGLADVVEVDSAGTHGYHVGATPDRRAMHHAGLRGYDLSRLRARPVAESDFERFDLILAMDWDNLSLLQEECPPGHKGKLRRLSEFASDHASPVVPDPYYGTAEGFEKVLDLIEDACDGLIRHLAVVAAQQPGTS
jgi:protein-tyrosine phosphatase